MYLEASESSLTIDRPAPGRLAQGELISSRWLSMAGTFARISTLDARHVLDVKDMLHLAKRESVPGNNAK
jgi:hypothetical protein